jgi:hypothetical protein
MSAAPIVERMARAILCAATAATSAGTVYLAGAFVAWDLDPGQWDVLGRLTVAFFGGFAGLLGGSIALATWDC